MATPQRLLLGITGGIAAYKAATVVSLAQKGGFEVRVIMTPAATKFVGPLTFEALSGHPVMTDTFETGSDGNSTSAVRHISWAKWADVACIVPLTAASMARLAHGLADNALATVWLALPAKTPNILCPAMNTEMWNHPLTQRNVAILRETGRFRWMNPIHKRLACGDVGIGALAEPDDIFMAIQSAIADPSSRE
jgi:phosphopantothenoylcysteine decarboxylase/phosphopantothenate--cysteine ligase